MKARKARKKWRHERDIKKIKTGKARKKKSTQVRKALEARRQGWHLNLYTRNQKWTNFLLQAIL